MMDVWDAGLLLSITVALLTLQGCGSSGKSGDSPSPPPTIEKCDPSCSRCSTQQVITAVPCDAKRSQQHGFSLGPINSTTKLRQILFSSSGGSSGSKCVTWNTRTRQLELQTCAFRNGNSWVNSTSYDCQQFVINASSGAISSPTCMSNVQRTNGCLDIHGKVGPGIQLTKCYAQPNDHFSFSVDGVWASQSLPPTYPQRCMEVNDGICPRAGCCTACAPDRHWTPDGFCGKHGRPRPKKVTVFLAGPSNQTSLDAVIAELKKHRQSFTGIAYQYFGICGFGSKDCSPEDSHGDPHLAPGHQGLPKQASPANLAEQFRAAFGNDVELFPMISYGDTTNITLLNQLWSSPELTAKFTSDAVQYALVHNITGMNIDIEPTAPWSQLPVDAWLRSMSEAFRTRGLKLSWDANGYSPPETGSAYDVDGWVDMGTYYGGDSYADEMQIGLYGVGRDRYSLGYCPSCQPLTKAEVEGRFTILGKTPGSGIREIWLWAFYGWGGTDQGSIDPGWKDYWPHLENWLHADDGDTTAVLPAATSPLSTSVYA